MNIQYVPRIFFSIIIFFISISIGMGQYDIAYAQQKQTVSQKKILDQVIDTNQDQQVYTSAVLPSQTSYQAGERLDYSFQMYNATPFDANSLYYKVIISDAKRGERAFSYQIRGPISIKAGETIKINDSVFAPKSVQSSRVVLRIVPVIQSAITYPFAQSEPFEISGALPAYEMGSWVLTTNDGKLYPFQAGPSLYQNATPSQANIEIWIKPQKEAGTLRYRMQVYKKTVGIGEAIYATTSDALIVTPQSKTKDEEGGLDVSIPLPTFSYSPGVYEAYIEFVDQEGYVRAPIIIARYIVQGDIATIQFARISKAQIKKGESATFIASITGSPEDIFTSNPATQMPAQMEAKVLNELGGVVALIKKDIQLTPDVFSEMDFIAQEDAQAMYVHMNIIKDGKVLAEWSSPVASDYTEIQHEAKQRRMNMIRIGALGILLILCIIALHAYLKRKNNSIAAICIIGFCVLGSSLALPMQAEATVGNPTVQVTFPAEGQILLPGQKFTPRASVYYKACANFGYNVNAQFFHNGNALDTLHSISSVAQSIAHCEGGTRRGSLCTDVGANSVDCPKSNGGRARCTFDTHEMVGPGGEDYASQVEATAPLIPGRYTVGAMASGKGFVSETEPTMYLDGTDENMYIVRADLQVPTVSAEASTTCTPGITLTWNAVPDADTYSILRSNESGDGYVTIGTATTDSYTDTTVVGAQTYFYKVVARSTETEQESEASASISATWTKPSNCDDGDRNIPTTGIPIIDPDPDLGCAVGLQYCPNTNTCEPRDGICGGGGNIPTPGTVPTPDTGCAPGQRYCPNTNICIPENENCDNPCARPIIQLDIPLAPNSLCNAGFTLVASTLFGSISTNSWHWACQRQGIPQNIHCTQPCPNNTVFDSIRNVCTSTITDWCLNIPGNQRDTTAYTRDDTGNCLASGSIKYFRFSPDIANATCPAFWETEVTPGAYAACKIQGGSVGSSHPIGSMADKLYPVGGQYTLSCDIKLEEDDRLIKTVETKARCFRNTDVIEI